MHQDLIHRKPFIRGLVFISILLIVALIATACQWVEDEDDTPIITVGAFNVQIFGTSKMSKEGIPEILVKIITRYDVILVQEVRDVSQTAIYDLLDKVNQTSESTYNLILSDRLGRTTSKEQYAYFYRPSSLTPLSNYHYDDGDEPDEDLFQREPFLVRFQSVSGNLDFALIGIHTDPGDAVLEIDGLTDVYTDMLSRWNDYDAIILGDFNADCSYVSEADQAAIRLWTQTRFTWWIDEDSDTTTSSTDCAYDRIVTNSGLNPYIIANSAGVFRFDQVYGLSNEFTRDISDHYPVEIALQP